MSEIVLFQAPITQDSLNFGQWHASNVFYSVPKI